MPAFGPLKATAALAAALGLLSMGPQPAVAGKAGTMEVVGTSGISAQMMFLGAASTVYMLDKAENNPAQVNGHPAWATAYNINSNTFRTMNINSNTFCAGGAFLGDGRVLATGGNQAVGSGGNAVQDGTGPYKDYDGGRVLRTLKPGVGSSWVELSTQLDKERWYPTVEPLKDGYVVIIGGMRGGGYVPSQGSNEPTYEFYPKKGNGASRYMDLLSRTVPLSLFPVTFLMSSGELFVQANKQAILWNYQSQSETRLPNVNGPPKVYPSSAGSVLLPLDPSNNYLETVLFCGGISLGTAAAWGNEGGAGTSLTDKSASNYCEQIQPLGNKQWTQVDSVPTGRSMGQFIILPDGTLWFGNGVKKGTAGYAADPNNIGKPIGQSYGDDPEYQPYIYNPKAAAGLRWTPVGRGSEPRMYHSSATLLPDSSILVSGSNPNADVSTKHWPTSYAVERWYPTYYDQTRPSNQGLPTSFSYGGKGFQLTFSNAADAAKASVVIIRTGFSTHAMNMGQRMITLRSSAVGNVLNVAQLPANPNLFAPGPALAFVVVNGVPSQGIMVMVGNGQIGTQPVSADTVLPAASVANKSQTSFTNSTKSSNSTVANDVVSSNKSSTAASASDKSNNKTTNVVAGVVNSTIAKVIGLATGSSGAGDKRAQRRNGPSRLDIS